jgi:peroxiredoxin family protein
MGVVKEGFFSTTTLALAPSLMLGFAAAASTAEVSCFTTFAGIVALTTAEVLVVVLMVFSFKTVFKKDSSGSAVSHHINFDLFVDAMGLMIFFVELLGN